MHQPTVYLAGPIDGLDYDEATGWRERAAAELAEVGITTLSPMRGKQHLQSSEVITGHYDPPMSTAKGITTRDRNDVLRCDLVLAYLKGAREISAGTCVEFGWADAWRKPVVMVEEPGGTHDHPMLTELAGFVMPTLDEALGIVRVVLGKTA